MAVDGMGERLAPFARNSVDSRQYGVMSLHRSMARML